MTANAMMKMMILKRKRKNKKKKKTINILEYWLFINMIIWMLYCMAS